MKRTGLRRSIIVALSVCLAVCCAVLGVYVYRENELDKIQREALAVLKDDIGTYDDQTIVLYDTDRASAQKLAEQLNAKLRITSDGRYATLTLRDGQTVRDVYEDRGNRALLEKFSLDYYSKTSEIEGASERVAATPNYDVSDSLYKNQSYINYANVGNAWNSYRGSGVTVAVIDTGIDTDHAEFAGKISEYSYNASEDKIVKDYTLADGGYDWSLIEDEQGHGTSVAGVVASSMNGEGVVGIAPEATLLIIKAECDGNGNFYRTSDLVFGLYYAIERDADVVNMSFGGNENAFERATGLAVDSDIICVAAAGNDATATPQYPAADENVIGVGALGENSWALATYSNYGENSDVVAPGTTYTAKLNGGYGAATGTSFAAPIVAGAMALLKQQNRYIEFAEAVELLYASSYDLGAKGDDWYFGYGALDISALTVEERGTVTFDMLTDEIEDIERVFIRNHALQNIPEPTRWFTVFDGWYYDIDLKEELELYDDVWTSDLTLYANWVNEDDGVPYTYVTLDDGTIEIRSYTGKRRYITVPEKIDGKLVTSIGDFAFDGQSRFRQVNLPSGLTNIGQGAFRNCNNLNELILPSGVNTIGDSAFENAVRLRAVGTNENGKLERIGSFAFAGSGLVRFDVPKNTSVLDGSAFFGATSLKSFSVAKENKNFTAKNGVLFNKTASRIVAFPAGVSANYAIPNGVTEVGDYAFGYAKFKNVDLNNVRTLGKSAFAYSSLESIAISDSVTAMGNGAFAYNFNLNSVKIGSGLVELPEQAFYGAFSLKEITIPKNIIVIKENAFALSRLEKAEFEADGKLLEIGKNAFSHTQIRELALPQSLIAIGEAAFADNYFLSSVTFAENSNLQSLGESAFERTVSLKAIDLPRGLLQIGDYAFKEAALAGEITIPASVTNLGAGAFAACRDLTAITVQSGNLNYLDVNGVVYNRNKTTVVAYPAGNAATEYSIETTTETVYRSAFYGAHNLNYVYLPESLSSIGQYAFYDVENLRSVSIPDNVVQISAYAFAQDYNLRNINFNETSKLPRISFAAFAYTGIYSVRIPANVSTMAQYAFEGCDSLTSVTFAANSELESIPAYAFLGAENVREITFENGSALKALSAHAFEGMSRLQSVNFGDAKLERIDNYAFRYCTNLTNIALPETLKEIGRFAFYGSKALTKIVLPASVEHIGRYAFYGAETLDVYFTAEILPASVSELGEYAFYKSGIETFAFEAGIALSTIPAHAFASTKISSVTIPESVDYIDDNAFRDCLSLQTVAFGTTKTLQVHANAFYNTGIRELVIPENMEYIGEYAFIGLENLTAYVADENNPNYKSVDGVLYSKDGKKLIAFPAGRTGSFAVPSTVETIGFGAFENTKIESVAFENGINLLTLGYRSFYNAVNLKTVEIPASVVSIDFYAFAECGNLETVIFAENNGLTGIYEGAFLNCASLENIVIPSGIVEISDFAFYGCSSLNKLPLGDESAVKGIYDYAFAYTGITELVLPNTVTDIGNYAFRGSKLKTVTIPDDQAQNLTIGLGAFLDCAELAEITLPFIGASFEDEKITWFGYIFGAGGYQANATYAPSSLKTVTITEGISFVGKYAFWDLSDIETIHVPHSVSMVHYGAFVTTAKYEFTNTISIDSDVLGHGYFGKDHNMNNCGISGDLVLAEGIVEIDYWVFQYSNLTSVYIPSSATSIGGGAFV